MLGVVFQLGTPASVGDPQMHFHKVRKESSDTSTVQTVPGVGLVLPDETFATRDGDIFVPEAANTVERRAMQKTDLFTPLCADPACEIFYDVAAPEEAEDRCSCCSSDLQQYCRCSGTYPPSPLFLKTA